MTISSPFLEEFRRIQNVGLGASCIWQFASGFAAGSGKDAGAPFQLCFLVLPLVFDKNSCQLISGTLKSSGLRAFAAKYLESKVSKTDVLLDIQRRVIEYQELSMESINLALNLGLCGLDTSDARVFASTFPVPTTKIGQDSRRILLCAEKFGNWCGPIGLDEISITLKVRF